MVLVIHDFWLWTDVPLCTVSSELNSDSVSPWMSSVLSLHTSASTRLLCSLSLNVCSSDQSDCFSRGAVYVLKLA